MVEKYENITFKVDDDLLKSLERNFKKNLKLYKDQKGYYSLVRPFTPMELVMFVYNYMTQYEEELPKEVIVDEKWLDKRFSNFAIGVERIERNNVGMSIDFERRA